MKAARFLRLPLIAALLLSSPGPAVYPALAGSFRASQAAKPLTPRAYHVSQAPVLAPAVPSGLSALSPVPSALPALSPAPVVPDASIEAAPRRAALSPLSPSADPGGRAAAPTAALLADPAAVSAPAARLEGLSAAGLKETGDGWMDRVLGVRSAASLAAVPAGSSVLGRARPGLAARNPGDKRWLDTHSFPELGKDEGSAPKAESPKPRRGVFGRLRDLLAGLIFVLPDRRQNREFWKFVGARTLLSIGTSFHHTALPALVQPPGQPDKGRVGVTRAVNWGAQALSNLLTGPYVDRIPSRTLLTATYVGRALLLFTIPVFFFNGMFTFALFQAIILAMGFLQSTGTASETVAFAKIIGKDEKYANRANGVYNLALFAVGVVAPLLAGSFIGTLNARYGALAGNALCYAVYGALAVASAAVMWFFVRVPGDKELAAPEERQTLLGAWKDMMEGFRLNWSNRFLRISLLFTTLEVAIGEVLVFTALPRFIREIMDPTTAAWIQNLPLIGPFLTGLASPAGAFGLYLSASALGLGLGTLAMTLISLRANYKSLFKRLDPLEFQATVTSILYGLGLLSYWGVFFLPNIWPSTAMFLLCALMQAPAMVVWASVHQRVMKENFPDKMGSIVTARSFYQLLCAVAGLLFFGFLTPKMSTVSVLWLMTSLMTVASALCLVEPFVVFPLKRK